MINLKRFDRVGRESSLGIASQNCKIEPTNNILEINIELIKIHILIESNNIINYISWIRVTITEIKWD